MFFLLILVHQDSPTVALAYVWSQQILVYYVSVELKGSQSNAIKKKKKKTFKR